MPQMMFSVLDALRSVHRRAEASFVDVLVPALSDDPETIAELQQAMRRFLPPDEADEPLADWAAGECDAPGDAGICLVDLAGRLIVYQSQVDEFLRRGQVTWDALDQDARPRWIPYAMVQLPPVPSAALA